MTKIKITTQYCAGVLDNIGGFYLHRAYSNRKSYIGFKIVTTKLEMMDKVADFLASNHKINLHPFKNKNKDSVTYYTNTICMVERISKFMWNHCFRNDYDMILNKKIEAENDGKRF